MAERSATPKYISGLDLYHPSASSTVFTVLLPSSYSDKQHFYPSVCRVVQQRWRCSNCTRSWFWSSQTLARQRRAIKPREQPYGSRISSGSSSTSTSGHSHNSATSFQTKRISTTFRHRSRTRHFSDMGIKMEYLSQSLYNRRSPWTQPCAQHTRPTN